MTTYDQNATLHDFLNAAAARQPTPGGGSVTALVGALSAAMGEMVINYSVGKKGLEQFEEQLKPAVAELTRARQLLLGLMVEDQQAYAGLTTARKLPDGPEKTEALAASLLASIRVPQAMAATAIRTLELVDQVLNFVNFQLLSDLAICADLAMATVRCGVYNVRVNVSQIADASERWKIETTNGQLLSHAAVLIQQVSPRIWARHGQGA